MGKYLDSSGVTYLWGKIKGLFTDSSLNTGAKTITGAINEINTKVNNLTGAFVWKGSFETEADKPSAATYNIGDVIGVAHKEYVCTEVNGAKTWVEFGDEANHITKDFAESTYLKNTASAVGTANLSDNAVTSAKLAVGTRNPIILTESTTEVDEETYQKLLRDDVDVVFKMNNADFLYRFTSESVGSGLMLNFSSLVAFPKKSIENVRVQGVQVTIKHTTPHTCKVFGIDSEPSLKNLIDDAKYLNKSTLTPILKEIDLTGTDAERKAKLDQFEADWKALTGSDSLDGARFVGRLPATSTGQNNVLLTYNWADGEYKGLCSDDSYVNSSVSVSTTNGSIFITPLFQHLEAVVLRISDGDSNADTVNAANKTSIENYVANLQSLGVSIEGTPCHFRLLKYKNGNYTNYTVNVGILRLTEKNSQYDFWIDGVKGGVDYETGKVTISSNLNTTLEAITIYTDNTEEHMQMNLDNIAAYEANLQALGVDTTKSPMIGVILTDEYYNPIGNGCIQYDPIEGAHIGYASQLNGDGYAETFTFKVDVSGFAYITKLAPESAVVSKSLNAKSLEAVTIKTSNSDADKAANVAAIKAYVNNLKSLGVDVTKGYMIPIVIGDKIGYMAIVSGTLYRGLYMYDLDRTVWFSVSSVDGTYSQVYVDFGSPTSNLTTTSKQIVGAINEVNAAVKTKASNIKDASSTGGINQAFDGGETLDVTSKNPNATALDSTITGALTRGATGQYASSFGGKSIAIGKRSFAEGTTTIAKGNYSHAEGDNSVALGSDSHVEGYQTTTGPSAMGAHAEGNGTQSLGAASHSEGSSTIAKGNTSHAEGADTKANGVASHAEGNGTKGDGNYSHAEGNGTSAIGSSSHAEGYITIAQGDMSHAEGALTKAIGSHSHTEGSNNTTNAGNSHAEGANNTVNNSKYTAPSGGSSGSTGSTEPSEPADFNIEEHYGEGGHAEGMYNNAYGYASHAEGAHNKSKAHYSHTEGQGNDASGEGAHAEGWSTVASGVHSHSEGQGTKAIGDNAHAEGNGSKATGSGSHAEGSGTAQGDNAHAEGASIANNSNAHAEGLSTTASGNGAHSEGHYTQATNNAAHAEGVHTTANGDGSHTEGWYTTAKNRAEHAEGFFNFSNSVSPSYYTEGNNTLHSVGIGTSDTNRKNAFEVMQNGDIYAYGVGGYDGTNAVNNASKTLKTVIESKQDKLVSGTNIKTVNGTSLLGSGNITISGGSGDITAAGNNTFTGNNTFSGETIIKNNIVFNSDGNGNIEVEQIPIGLQLGSNGSEIIVSGVATPVDTLDAANKKYVDDQITAKLGTVLTQLQNI